MNELGRKLQAQRAFRDAARRLVQRDVDTLKGANEADAASARLKREAEEAAMRALREGASLAGQNKGRIAGVLALVFAAFGVWFWRDRLAELLGLNQGTGEDERHSDWAGPDAEDGARS